MAKSSVAVGLIVLSFFAALSLGQERPPANNDTPKVRVDFQGDLLREGAIVRLGSARFQANRVRDVAFAPDGKTIASAGNAHTIHLWDAASGKLLLKRLDGSVKEPAKDTPPQQQKKDAVDEKTIKALIAQLGDDSFDKREAAQKALAAVGLPAFELVRKAATETADLEVRERAGNLVKELNHLRFVGRVKDKLWGYSVDPDGDCRFLMDFGKLHITIPGKPHRLSGESGPNAVNSPRVLREIEGDFSVQVQVPSPAPFVRPYKGNSSPWFGAGLLVWQDDKNYLRLERARSTTSQNTAPSYASWEIRLAGKHTRQGAFNDGRFEDSQTAFLKLARKGNVFSAAYSRDGDDWSDLQPFTADFTKKLLVGVSATHNTLTPFEAVFDRFKITASK